MRRAILAVLLAILMGTVSQTATGAQIVVRDVLYHDGDDVLEGKAVFDNSGDEVRPGVLIIHQWKGISEHELRVARELAALGYVAFCADIYGQGVRPETSDEAGRQAGIYRGGDRQNFRGRIAAGLDALRDQPFVDPGQLAVIGYCFGGTGALEAARMGADVRAVVSFHGGLSAPEGVGAEPIESRVLVLHGADDPLVPDDEVVAFFNEMRGSGAEWTFVGYGGAVHSFTDRNASTPGVSAYDADADRASWRDMHALFAEVFEVAEEPGGGPQESGDGQPGGG